MPKKKRSIIGFGLLVLIVQSASSFDPCENFDLRECDPAAECFSDKRQIPECRCPPGYVDLSLSPDKPGRKCQKIEVVNKDGSCSVTDPLSCDAQKSEVCLFVDGKYKCACPQNYGRLADGRCLLINECLFPKLNDCPLATSECVDKDVGFECRCRGDLVDMSPEKPGRKCGVKKDCTINDCHENAKCVETSVAFECRCLPGFADISVRYSLMPGRKCVEILNECEDPALHDCSPYATCSDLEDGYSCVCLSGYVDASPNKELFPGRICSKPTDISLPPDTFPKMNDLCDHNSSLACRPFEVCVDNKLDGNYRCECSPTAFRYRDGSCKLKSACETNNDCDVNAICINSFGTISCQCKDGWYDASPETSRPGRVCKKLQNECADNTHTCALNAKCEDRRNGYTCICDKNYLDSSSKYGLEPGRICTLSTNECADKSLNTCDENADCIDTPDGYLCNCFEGFVDVSSSANLLPGRVCTIATSCTKQKTDLMFLVDGSGSIGAHVFGNEILRFISEFIDLFDISLDQTRVGFIQYSDQVRHEFDLGQYNDKNELKRIILQTEYLTGLTRTGAAIKHMTNEAFSERRGARPVHSKNVSRVAIIITDGRSQDNVTIPALDAQTFFNINMFAIGVTDHVLTSELETISGSPDRWFFVNRFKDLDTRLRSLIQKIACPAKVQSPGNKCEVGTQQGCNRALNEICALRNGQPQCVCPTLFERHPVTKTCGHPECNPDLPTTSCPTHEICARTPFGRHRCVCQEGYRRDSKSGVCLSKFLALPSYSCTAGTELNPRTGKCVLAGSCDPDDAEACDVRKNEKCLMHPNGQHFTCRCEGFQRRHPLTQICLTNECQNGQHDCDPNAVCIDTDSGYICACPQNFVDKSSQPNTKPGRVCARPIDECLTKQNDCSPFSICIDNFDGYSCRCRDNYTDLSANQRLQPGRVCIMQIDECADSTLNDCHPEAVCANTHDAFTCQCKPGFSDIEELRHPGRNCVKGNVNECRNSLLNRCSHNAVCIDEPHGYRCECKNNFIDKSPPGTFGFICEAPKHPCNDSELNDCAVSATCIPNGPSFNCKCLSDFVDQSPDENRPGRVCVREQPACSDPKKNDCHPNAHCLSLSDSNYTCSCREGYQDKSPTKLRPGRVCVELLNECLEKRFNDCDKIALCEDLTEGFQCRCPQNSIDRSPNVTSHPGRVCIPTIDECSNPKLNECSRFANCIEEIDGYTCACIKGYHDDSPDPQKPGRICALVNEDFKVTSTSLSLSNTDEIQCGKEVCFASLNEVCIDSSHCECLPTDIRPTKNGRCVHVQRIPLSIRIMSRNDRPLLYSSQYNDKKNMPYIEFVNVFKDEMTKVFNLVVYAPKYVTTEVNAITHPKTVNTTWSDGLLVNFTVAVKQSDTLIDKCEMWDSFFDSVTSSGNQLGQLSIASDSFLLNPCPSPDNYCAGTFCSTELGEVCLRGKCVINYCSDVQFCPSNTTCINLADRSECECNPGFVDIRESAKRRFVGLANDVYCLREHDVDECALGLHNCSVVAQCTNQPHGYKCTCPPSYIDGNPADPGRICAALLCDLCHGHGDCIPDSATSEIKCLCAEGFSGAYCELSSSSLPYVVLILLALMFLIATMCCLFYICSKCHCFRRIVPWSALNQTHSTAFSDKASELYSLTIPRPKIVAVDTTSTGTNSSDFTINEDAERQVITEITRTEFLGGSNDDRGEEVLNAYHSITEYDSNSRGAHAQIEHHQAYVTHPSTHNDFDYGQDDRSVESYHTTDQRIYESGSNEEFRNESVVKHR